MLLRLYKRSIYILIIITLLIATALRLYCLTNFPPGISGDEIANGQDITGLLTHPYLTVFFPANTGREGLFFYLGLIIFAILGPTLFALRLVPALVGILLVALSYRWTRELLPPGWASKWIALITAIFIATSPWGVYNSRIGLRGSLLPLFMLPAYLFFWYGYKYSQRRWFVISGIFLGLSTYTYTSSRLLPLTFVLFVLGMTLCYRHQLAERINQLWRGLGLTGLVSLIIFLPLGWYFINHPQAFWFRSTQVTLFNGHNFEFASGDNSFVKSILTEWMYYFYLFFNFTTPWVQNKEFFFILQWIPWLFWLGVFLAFYWAWHQPAYLLLIISFFVGLLPMLWSFPTTMRLVIAFPQTYVLLTIGVYYLLALLLKWVRNLRFVMMAAASVIILLISTLSAVSLFSFERWVVGFPGLPYAEQWVYLAHLPTLHDQAVDVSAHQIKDLVLQKKHSVLVPQVFFDLIKFTLQTGFTFSPEVKQDKFLPTDTIYIVWSPFLGNQPGSFVLLSPHVADNTGGVELWASWKREEISSFVDIMQRQQFEPDTIFVNDAAGQLLGFMVKVERQKVINALEKPLPQN